MIDKVLVSLKNNLSTYLSLGKDPSELQEDQVVFIEWTKNSEAIDIKSGAVSILLINLEQENILRADDPYSRIRANGMAQKGNPEVRLNLYLLFISHYTKYDDTLKNLSAVIQYFQGHRVLNHQNSPQLSEDIEQLLIEPVAITLSEQNEIWGTLRLPYHTSILYRVKSVFYRDEEPSGVVSVVEEKIVRISE